MAFMTPGADYFTRDEVHEIVATNEFDEPDHERGDGCTCVAGWYGNLSAAGYLDHTDYMGPYDTAAEAIAAVCEFYDVDVNGDDVNDDDGTEVRE